MAPALRIVRVDHLPVAPLAAAADFHARVLPDLLADAGGDAQLLLIFAPADHTHRGWRVEVVVSLARSHAPARVNAVVSDDEAAIAATTAWLTIAPGVTGQVLQLNSQGAGAVVG